MNTLLQTDVVTEILNSQNVSYLLNDSSRFFVTEYKVLKNKENSGLIKCAKVLLNGNIKLIYFTAGRKNLKSVLPSIDADKFMGILASLFCVLIDIKNNGFLHCQNLVLEEEKIFVDMNTLDTSLVYLPLNNTETDQQAFENDFRSWIIKLITSVPSLMNAKTDNLRTQLASGVLSFEKLYQYICSESKGGMSNMSLIDNGLENTISVEAMTEEISQKPMMLVAMNMSSQFALEVNKSEFVIGKSATSVDGLIAFNNAVSRRHCKIVWQNNTYYIVDLGSANGTYVNKMKLSEQQYQPLNKGDIVRLANIEFVVQM